MLLLLLLLLVVISLKGKEKARGEEKSKMRGSGSSYIPLSALTTTTAFRSFQIPHVHQSLCFETSHVQWAKKCNNITKKPTFFLQQIWELYVLWLSLDGWQGRTCERYILWSVVMPSTPVCWYNYSHYVLALYRHHEYLACLVPINTNQVNCFELCAYPCKDPHLY